MIPTPVAIGTWSGLSVYDLAALQQLDASNLAQGTPVYVSSMGKPYYLRGDIAPMMPGAVPVLGAAPAGQTWVPFSLLPSDPFVGLVGALQVGGTKIPGLELGLEADDGVTVSTWAAGTAGPIVTAWKDKTGFGTREPTPVGSPILLYNGINGRPAIKFNPGYFTGATSLGSGGSTTSTDRGARTIFVVALSNDAVGGSLFCDRASVTNNCYVSSHLVTGGNVMCRASGGGDQNFLTDVPPISGVPHIWEFIYDGLVARSGAASAPRVLIDGLEKAVTPSAMNVTETGTAGYVLGNFLVNGTIWNGPIAAFYRFNRALTPFERMLVRQGLSIKYAIPTVSPSAQKTTVLAYGHSHTLGTGDATAIAAGGWRKELQGRHSNLMFVGSVCAPAPSLTALPPDPTNTDAFWRRCEAWSGFTTAIQAVHGMGGMFAVQSVGNPLPGASGNPPDVIFGEWGINDNVVDGLTAAQTAANTRQLVDTFAAICPQAKVIVLRDPLLRTDHPNAGTANPIMIAAGLLMETALIGATNVLRHPALVTALNTGGAVIIPSLIPDSLYGDTTHPTALGWHFVIEPGGTAMGGLDAELRARGL